MSIHALCLSSEEDCYILKRYTHLDRRDESIKRHALTQKTRTFHHSCYSNKLKRYKIRKYDDDDENVLDISNCLSSVLSLKSPKKSHNSPVNNNSLTCTYRSNYLVKMARKNNKVGSEKNDGVGITRKSKNIDVKESSEERGKKSFKKSAIKKKIDAFQLLMNKKNKLIESACDAIAENKAKKNKKLSKRTGETHGESPEVKQLTEVRTSCITNKTKTEVVNANDVLLQTSKKRKRSDDAKGTENRKKSKTLVVVTSFESKSDDEEHIFEKKTLKTNKKENMLNYFEKVRVNLDKKQSEENDKDNVAEILKCKNENVSNPDDIVSNGDCKNIASKRPRRNVKKPIKYAEFDDYEDDSLSDQIFTPIKKTHRKSSTQLADNVKPEYISKMAPIFTKGIINKEALEAKVKFLQSGIPENIKKKIEKAKVAEINNDLFLAVVHIQQKTDGLDSFDPWNLPQVNLQLKDDDSGFEELIKPVTNNFCLKTDSVQKTALSGAKENTTDVKLQLQKIKERNELFPVYRTYRLLKAKTVKDNDSNEAVSCEAHNSLKASESVAWTEKYKALASVDIVGNFNSVNNIRNWLSNWMQNNCDIVNSQLRKMRRDSASSDFNLSDTDSRDGMKSLDNVLVVTGPTGSGKTFAIYTITNEMSMKVLEINASSKRNGKKIVAELQEATQSHKVNRNRGGSSTESSQNSQEFMGLPVGGKAKKEKHKSILKDMISSQKESEGTAMSVILIDDADLVFEQDEGFISGLTQLVHSTKRPVIIVASDVMSPHLSKFINGDNVVRFQPLRSTMLGPWLDVLCLVECGRYWNNLGESLVNYCCGDIRKAINLLQFWTRDCISNANSKDTSMCKEDQSDNFDENQFGEIESCNTDKLGESFPVFSLLESFGIPFDSCDLFVNLNLFNVWWNILDNPEETKDNETRNLTQISKTIDTISRMDVIDRAIFSDNILGDKFNSLNVKLSDSVTDFEDFNGYSSSCSLHNTWRKTCLDLSLGKCSLLLSKDTESMTHKFDVKMRNNHKLLDAIPINAQLDRRNLTVDYFSQLRTICRVERSRSNLNAKRNNRFCHYLNTLKVSSSMDAISALCESFN